MKDNFDIFDSSSCLKNSSQTSECPIFNRKYFYILNNYIIGSFCWFIYLSYLQQERDLSNFRPY